MIGYIKGTLEGKTPEYVLLESNSGIGFKIYMSSPSMAKLGEIGASVKVYTYMRVLEDDISLYGFVSGEELRMFELLLSVSGIGAKSALSILSAILPSSFALAVLNDDLATLKKLPGVGVKSAQRIVLELKDKLKAQEKQEQEETQGDTVMSSILSGNDDLQEAISALQVLGYSKKECEEAFAKADIEGMSIEDMIKLGLKNLAR